MDGGGGGGDREDCWARVADRVRTAKDEIVGMSIW